MSPWIYLLALSVGALLDAGIRYWLYRRNGY